MNTFDHPKIGEPLVKEIADALAGSQSVALLGGRNVGKRFVLRKVYKRLVEQGRRVRVASLLHWGDESLQRITAAETLGMIPDIMKAPNEIIEWWQEAHAPADPSGPILLIGNFDSLSMPEGVKLVGALRRIGWSRIGASFEVQSADLFRGESPLLAFDRNAIVTRFDADEFRRFAEAYIERLWPGRRDHDQIIANLYDQTGGNLHFLRVALWTHFDLIAAADGSTPERLELKHLTDQEISHQVPWDHYLRYVTRLIGNSPDVWDRVETLVKEDPSRRAGTSRISSS